MLIHCLTADVFQAGDASGTAFLDVRQLCWDPRPMALVDVRVRGMLPDLIGPDEVRTL